MHRRLWLTAGVAVALLAVGATASATTSSSSSAKLAAAPFAQAWANVPRTTAARKAKDTLVFGMEQDVTGFNTSEESQSAFWAVLTGNTPVVRGSYNIDDQANYFLDLATKVTATRSGLT